MRHKPQQVQLFDSIRLLMQEQIGAGAMQSNDVREPTSDGQRALAPITFQPLPAARPPMLRKCGRAMALPHNASSAAAAGTPRTFTATVPRPDATALGRRPGGCR
jgi:hypothetical protein